MKSKLFPIITICLLMTLQLIAQNQIVVQNGSNVSLYTKLDSAIVHSDHGDTVYIPGGPSLWTISQPINKRLHIFGVGHNPDSTLATGYTQINGNISLIPGATGGSLTGINLNGSMLTTGSIENYSIIRCIFGFPSLTSECTNWSFIENIIAGNASSLGSGVTNLYFSNNIMIIDFGSFNNGLNSCIFKNNIFLNQVVCGGWGEGCWGFPIKANSSIFENNIFLSTLGPCSAISNSIFNNNLFVHADPLSTCSGCWGSNNILDQPQSSIFVNQSGYGFDYNHDYHLQSSSPGNNAGTDGTDVGIYGGPLAWKEGSLPENPHIQLKHIGGASNQNGNLQINVKVKAQNN